MSPNIKIAPLAMSKRNADSSIDHVNEPPQNQPLLEIIPQNLFEWWKRGPLLVSEQSGELMSRFLRSSVFRRDRKRWPR